MIYPPRLAEVSPERVFEELKLMVYFFTSYWWLMFPIGFFLFGEGNVPWRVRELLCKAEPDPAKQPRVIIG